MAVGHGAVAEFAVGEFASAAANVEAIAAAGAIEIVGSVPVAFITETPDLILHPVATDTAGGWVTELGGTNLHVSIDEMVADDNDYIRSSDDPTTDESIVRLDSGSVDTTKPVTVEYRYRKEGPGTINLTVRLMSPSITERASAIHNGISASFVDGELVLTEAEAIATDWSDAFLAFSADLAA